MKKIGLAGLAFATATIALLASLRSRRPLVDTEETLYPSAFERTEFHIRRMILAIAKYEQARGTLPARLEEVSETESQASNLPDASVDAWGHRLVYSPTDSGYELRSVGSHGAAQTVDDMAYFVKKGSTLP